MIKKKREVQKNQMVQKNRDGSENRNGFVKKRNGSEIKKWFRSKPSEVV